MSHCDKCGNESRWYKIRWCRPCQINNLRNNFTQWTSENEIIDNFIQEKQLNVNSHHDIVFEWIPYNQFDNIKEIRQSDSTAVYSELWKDGLLRFDMYKKEYARVLDKEVSLKCFYNSRN